MKHTIYVVIVRHNNGDLDTDNLRTFTNWSPAESWVDLMVESFGRKAEVVEREVEL
jgi:hypothetical protein